MRTRFRYLVDFVIKNYNTNVNNDDFGMSLEPIVFYNLKDKSLTKQAIYFKDKTIHAVAGIGNPLRFFQTLRQLGLNIVEHAFPDHYSFKKSDFPFAKEEVLKKIKTDKYKVYLKKNGNTISLDGTRQLNLDLISMFFHNLDFGKDNLASRFWPLGKKYQVVCDPHHKFGQPTINGTNIQSEAIYNMYKANEPISFIASIYEVSEKAVKDAIKFHKTAA